jgi:hypothetical protein
LHAAVRYNAELFCAAILPDIERQMDSRKCRKALGGMDLISITHPQRPDLLLAAGDRNAGVFQRVEVSLFP